MSQYWYAGVWLPRTLRALVPTTKGQLPNRLGKYPKDLALLQGSAALKMSQ